MSDPKDIIGVAKELQSREAENAAAYNLMIDFYKLSNLPILKYKPTVWQRFKNWLKAFVQRICRLLSVQWNKKAKPKLFPPNQNIFIKADGTVQRVGYRDGRWEYEDGTSAPSPRNRNGQCLITTGCAGGNKDVNCLQGRFCPCVCHLLDKP